MKADVFLADGTREERLLDRDHLSAPIPIPRFTNVATVLRNQPPTGKWTGEVVVRVLPSRQDPGADIQEVRTTLQSDPLVFGQMLAKIALGVAVARLGIDGFVPLVRDFIRTRPEEAEHWVGVGPAKMQLRPMQPLPGDQAWLHELGLAHWDTPAGRFIVAGIRLFAEFGAPANYVVVGRPLDGAAMAPPSREETP